MKEKLGKATGHTFTRIQAIMKDFARVQRKDL